MGQGAIGPPDSDRVSNQEPRQESGSDPTPRGPVRRNLLPYIVVVVVTFFVTWFVLATITGYPVGLGPAPVAKAPSSTSTAGVILAIDNPFDTARNSTADQFAPANFTVPAHTLLEFTIINFDTGLNPVSPLEATVNGTVGDCIYLNSTPTSLGPCVNSVNPGFVAHTFSFENGTYSGFNVPIPSANESMEGGTGTTVTFFAYFNDTGTFYWHCEAPCDPWSMATEGFMQGTMTVVAP